MNLSEQNMQQQQQQQQQLQNLQALSQMSLEHHSISQHHNHSQFHPPIPSHQRSRSSQSTRGIAIVNSSNNINNGIGSNNNAGEVFNLSYQTAFSSVNDQDIYRECELDFTKSLLHLDRSFRAANKITTDQHPHFCFNSISEDGDLDNQQNEPMQQISSSQQPPPPSSSMLIRLSELKNSFKFNQFTSHNSSISKQSNQLINPNEFEQNNTATPIANNEVSQFNNNDNTESRNVLTHQTSKRPATPNNLKQQSQQQLQEDTFHEASHILNLSDIKILSTLTPPTPFQPPIFKADHCDSHGISTATSSAAPDRRNQSSSIQSTSHKNNNHSNLSTHSHHNSHSVYQNRSTTTATTNVFVKDFEDQIDKFCDQSISVTNQRQINRLNQANIITNEQQQQPRFLSSTTTQQLFTDIKTENTLIDLSTTSFDRSSPSEMQFQATQEQQLAIQLSQVNAKLEEINQEQQLQQQQQQKQGQESEKQQNQNQKIEEKLNSIGIEITSLSTAELKERLKEKRKELKDLYNQRIRIEKEHRETNSRNLSVLVEAEKEALNQVNQISHSIPYSSLSSFSLLFSQISFVLLSKLLERKSFCKEDLRAKLLARAEEVAALEELEQIQSDCMNRHPLEWQHASIARVSESIDPRFLQFLQSHLQEQAMTALNSQQIKDPLNFNSSQQFQQLLAVLVHEFEQRSTTFVQLQLRIESSNSSINENISFVENVLTNQINELTRCIAKKHAIIDDVTRVISQLHENKQADATRNGNTNYFEQFELAKSTIDERITKCQAEIQVIEIDLNRAIAQDIDNSMKLILLQNTHQTIKSTQKEEESEKQQQFLKQNNNPIIDEANNNNNIFMESSLRILNNQLNYSANEFSSMTTTAIPSKQHPNFFNHNNNNSLQMQQQEERTIQIKNQQIGNKQPTKMTGQIVPRQLKTRQFSIIHDAYSQPEKNTQNEFFFQGQDEIENFNDENNQNIINQFQFNTHERQQQQQQQRQNLVRFNSSGFQHQKFNNPFDSSALYEMNQFESQMKQLSETATATSNQLTQLQQQLQQSMPVQQLIQQKEQQQQNSKYFTLTNREYQNNWLNQLNMSGLSSTTGTEYLNRSGYCHLNSELNRSNGSSSEFNRSGYSSSNNNSELNRSMNNNSNNSNNNHSTATNSALFAFFDGFSKQSKLSSAVEDPKKHTGQTTKQVHPRNKRSKSDDFTSCSSSNNNRVIQQKSHLSNENNKPVFSQYSTVRKNSITPKSNSSQYSYQQYHQQPTTNVSTSMHSKNRSVQAGSSKSILGGNTSSSSSSVQQSGVGVKRFSQQSSQSTQQQQQQQQQQNSQVCSSSVRLHVLKIECLSVKEIELVRLLEPLLVKGTRMLKKFSQYQSLKQQPFDPLQSHSIPPESCGFGARVIKLNANLAKIDVFHPQKLGVVETSIPLDSILRHVVPSSTRELIRRQKQFEIFSINPNVHHETVSAISYYAFSILLAEGGRIEFIAHDLRTFHAWIAAIESLVANKKALTKLRNHVTLIPAATAAAAATTVASTPKSILQIQKLEIQY